MDTDILDRDLPKWPHMILKGNKITSEQAKDIIFKCDNWFTETTLPHSNVPRNILKEYRKQSGLSELDNISEHMSKNQSDDKFRHNIRLWELMEKLQTHIKAIDLEYVRCDMADSHYIGGANGTVDSHGNVFFDRNIGKWPSTKEVYNELKVLVDAFPYLEFCAALYDAEKCQRDEISVKQVIGFIAKNQEVIITNIDLGLDMYTSNDDFEIDQVLSGNGSCGIPDQWFLDYADIIKNALNETGIDDEIRYIKKELGMT